jgi:hypothetical protein
MDGVSAISQIYHVNTPLGHKKYKLVVNKNPVWFALGIAAESPERNDGYCVMV